MVQNLSNDATIIITPPDSSFLQLGKGTKLFLSDVVNDAKIKGKDCRHHPLEQGRNHKSKVEGDHHGERGSASLYGVWGLSPQWGPGAKTLVGGQGAKPPEAEAYITIAGVNFCLKITAE
jgi:hypothetical protein